MTRYRRMYFTNIDIRCNPCGKHLVIAVALILAVVFLILANLDQNGQSSSTKYTYLRGRLKSTGNYSIAAQNVTNPITWHSLGTLLSDDVTKMPFPTEFFKCLPGEILKAVENNESLNSVPVCGRIFYNRVPKCGSRTVLSVFRKLSVQRNYTGHSRVRPNGRSFFSSMHALIQFGMNFSQLEEPFIYSQHLHFVNFTQMGIPPPMYLNVIRNPVDRVISHFFYNKYGSRSDDRHPTHNVSLDDCVRSMSDCPFLPIHVVLPYFCGQTKFCRKDSQGTLQRAKRTLKQSFLVVGLTEDLPAFLEVLEKLIPEFFTNATNVYNEMEEFMLNKTETVKKPSVQPHTVLHLKDMLSHEYDFYNFAKQRFYTLYDKIPSLTVNKYL